MKPSLRSRRPAKVMWDCPWNGHEPDPTFLLKNSNAPNVIGIRCIKCRCLIYEMLPEIPPESQLVLPETVMAEVETGE